MTLEKNKAIAERFIKEVFVNQDERAADELTAADFIDPASAASVVLGHLEVSAEEARDLRHGKRLPGAASRLTASPIAAIDPDGRLVGIVERRGDDIKSAMNMPEEAP